MAVTEAEAIGAELVGRYAIVEVLGHGTSATVFLAVDARHHRRVALKALSAAVGETLGVERFQREILTVARLQHPNILPLFDSGTAAGRLWYTMPFVESGSLRDRLTREGQMSVAVTTQLVREVADALTYAHDGGVIHRDIKPENIMLSPEGHALVADFGLARAAEDATGPSTTGAGIVVGTPLYMSPEQALGDSQVDARADVYALATVAYEMLAGATPFEGDSARLVMTRRILESPPSARVRRPELPKALDAILLRALARDPAERFATAAEFAAALTNPRKSGGAEERKSRWWWKAGIAALLTAALVLGVRHRLLRSSAPRLIPAPPVSPSFPSRISAPPRTSTLPTGSPRRSRVAWRASPGSRSSHAPAPTSIATPRRTSGRSARSSAPGTCSREACAGTARPGNRGVFGSHRS
ncbi:MAG: protein kinase domain-containing protein [Gemmatimonadales bacterium]